MTKEIPRDSVLDMFSGTTRVSRLFAGLGSRVHSNDISDWSRVFGTCYFLNDQPAAYYAPLIDHLNIVAPLDGWFTAHYGGVDRDGSAVQADGTKALWQLHNTRKLDRIRAGIERLDLTPDEEAVALTSLIYALDSIDSTIGHYAAYLKRWSPRSYKTMVLKVPRVEPARRPHSVSQVDANVVAHSLAADGELFDLAYFDPPYGPNNEKMPPSRVRYASYYHIWTTVIRNDQPEVFGAASRRIDSRDHIAASQYEEFRTNPHGEFIAVEALRNAVMAVPARFVLLSYSNGGRATIEQLRSMHGEVGSVEDVCMIDYKKNVMASMRWTDQWVRSSDEKNVEYLFLVRKR
ncbi:MAG: DNA adenine methylase [Corynebacterium sp.]|nr:DNA adenine methylase [Corynebacterium sp.]